MKKVLILDNYDSFTWNLYHYVQQFTDEVIVKYNDEVEMNEVHQYSHIILSPGPGLPKDAGKLMAVIEKFHSEKKIMGVCLGMQALVEFYGGKLYNLSTVLHGVSSVCSMTTIPEPLFTELPADFKVGHYHSWAADQKFLPECLKITSKNENEIIMSVRHQTEEVVGIQFHPESVLTENGISIIKNWLK